jgi:hypothetical protein
VAVGTDDPAGIVFPGVVVQFSGTVHVPD